MKWDLIPMAVGFTLLFGYLAVRFHYKDKNQRGKTEVVKEQKHISHITSEYFNRIQPPQQ
jgi:hypothetical protein